MGQRLNILENALDKPVEKQLESINLALQTINGWGSQVRSSLVLDHTDPIPDELTTTSQEWENLRGLSADFKPNNSLVQFIVKIYLSFDGEGTIGIFVDNELIDNFYFVTGQNDTKIMCGFFQTSSGITHNITIKWKSIAGGMLHKYGYGNNKIQLIAINN